jgi:hypothetical protein
MNRADIIAAQDVIAAEVCRRCEYGRKKLPGDKVCARMAELLVLEVAARFEKEPGYQEASGDEVLGLEIAEGVRVDTTIDEFENAIDAAADRHAEAARNCSLAFSRFKLNELRGRLNDGEVFTPTPSYTQSEVLQSIEIAA